MMLGNLTLALTFYEGLVPAFWCIITDTTWLCTLVLSYILFHMLHFHSSFWCYCWHVYIFPSHSLALTCCFFGLDTDVSYGYCRLVYWCYLWVIQAGVSLCRLSAFTHACSLYIMEGGSILTLMNFLSVFYCCQAIILFYSVWS